MRRGLLFGCVLLFLLLPVLALGDTYVFPYEGFRYTKQAEETVITQTNTETQKDFIAALGTTSEAMLANFIASGTVMEVFSPEGSQVAVLVASDPDITGVSFELTSPDARDAVLSHYEESGLYDSCSWTDTTPRCIRLVSSAMYASMPVYSLRYVTLRNDRLYTLHMSIVGHEPAEEDDGRMQTILSGIHFFDVVPEPTATPTPAVRVTETAVPEATPQAVQAAVISGNITLMQTPTYTNDRNVLISGTTDPNAALTLTCNEQELAKATSGTDGVFRISVNLPEEGDNTLLLTTDNASAQFVIRYELPATRLEITGPEETTFTGEGIVIRGVTEPEATVFVNSEIYDTNVKANRNGAFSVRVVLSRAGTYAFNLRVKTNGHSRTNKVIYLTRVLTEREEIAAFRNEVIPLEYSDLAAHPERYVGEKFIFRGKVMEFTDYNGSPCALVCVSNPNTGVWNNPLYAVLKVDAEVNIGDVMTFYLTGEGITLPADRQYTSDGRDTEAPVARAFYYSTNR